MKPLFEIGREVHGRGDVVFKWQSDRNYLATSGMNGLVHIYDRHGNQVDEVALNSGGGNCLQLDWDKDGEILAILVDGSANVLLYDLSNKKTTDLETGLKDPCFIAWSKVGPQLAIGTAKGGLLIYRKDTLKKVPVMGKHSGEVVYGCWDNNNMLALSSKDKTVSLSNADGDTIEQLEVKTTGTQLRFCPAEPVESKSEDSQSVMIGQRGTTVAVNVGHKAVMLYGFDSGDDPVELVFQQRYGNIVCVDWCGPTGTNLLLAFSEGFLVQVSTNPDEIGEELFSMRAFNTKLEAAVYNRVNNRVALFGDGCVKLVDIPSWKVLDADRLQVDPSWGQLTDMQWTDGGEILSFATSSGHVAHFLAKIPSISGHYGVFAAFLSSLRELSVVDVANEYHGNTAVPVKIPLSVEPSFLALGANHVGVGMNNRAWFYLYRDNTALQEYIDRKDDPNLSPEEQEHLAELVKPVNEQEYMGSVDHMELNCTHAAVLCSGRVHLHTIKPTPQDANNAQDAVTGGKILSDDSSVFPSFEDSETQGEATCLSLTDNFLVYGTKEGFLQYFSIEDGVTLAGSELRHVVGIRAVFANRRGTRTIVIDDSGSGFLFNPVDCQLLPVPEMNPRTVNVLWDEHDPNVFYTTDNKEVSTYVFCPLSINGPQVTKIGPVEVSPDSAGGELIQMEPLSTKLPSDYVPIACYKGSVTCQLPNAQLGVMVPGSHQATPQDITPVDENLIKARFCQYLALCNFPEAWKQALMLNLRPYWIALSSKAMEQMHIEVAIDVWRQLGDAGMVMALEEIRFVEEKHELTGHIASLFGDYGQAQELFLLSPHPQAALEMRRDLLHWDHALLLAENLASEDVPEISMQYAHQLEFKGEYQQALQLYESAEQGLGDVESKEGTLVAEAFESLVALKQQCVAGIARMTLRIGNIPKGVGLAMKLNDPVVCRDCADILVTVKQFPDAATLYEKAGEFEQAASILIKAKNFKAAAPLMAKITAPRLHLQFAKAKEAEKDYKVAAQEYGRAKDMDSVVRLYLDHLKLPEKAFTIVRHTQSSAGADMVARYCKSLKDFRGAIEFMLMAKRSADAFDLATENDCMEVYERALGGDGSPEEYVKVAHYYETKHMFGKAGEFYATCGQYHKALKLFLQNGEPADIDKAIDVVGKARNDMLTHTLIDFLMGDTNGTPQPPKYIFRLYMALGNFAQAAKTAIIIARQEQELGNYKDAHKTLFETHHELEARGIRVPRALRKSLLILHSYLIVKKLAKLGDHDIAARLLIRVAKNISKFPAHVVPILTSTVIECYRAKLRKSAFEYASMLTRPEYRNQIDDKFKRKIEAIVRKKGSDPLEDEEEEMTPCPYTGKLVPITELVCPVTKNDIPYCVVTGKHMVMNDWCICPNSKMPALYSEYVKYLEALSPEERVDPMTGSGISVAQLEKVKDPKPFLDAYSASYDDTNGDEDDEEEDSHDN